MELKHLIIILIAGVFVWTLTTIKSTPYGSPDKIVYRGESIQLTKWYSDYDSYKNDPNNIHPSEISKIERLMTEAKMPSYFKDRKSLMQEVFNLVFPGYGLSILGEREQSDGSILTAFLFEIPQVDKDRVLVFRKQDEHYTLIDDFVYSTKDYYIDDVVENNEKLEYKTNENTTVMTRKPFDL